MTLSMERFLLLVAISLLLIIPKWGIAGGCTVLSDVGTTLSATKQHKRRLQSLLGREDAAIVEDIIFDGRSMVGHNGQLMIHSKNRERIRAALGRVRADAAEKVLTPWNANRMGNKVMADKFTHVLKEAAVKVDHKVIPVPDDTFLKRIINSKSAFANERLVDIGYGTERRAFLVTSNLGGFHRLKAFISPENPLPRFNSTHHMIIEITKDGRAKVIAPTITQYLPPRMVADVLFGRRLRAMPDELL